MRVISVCEAGRPLEIARKIDDKLEQCARLESTLATYKEQVIGENSDRVTLYAAPSKQRCGQR